MSMNNTITEDVHISQITHGDTIEHNGKVTTISRNNIKRGGFCGTTIFGDSYNMGTKLVKRVKFVVPTNKGIVLR